MIQIQISGCRGEGKTLVAKIIEKALRESGKRPMIVCENDTIEKSINKVDCVIREITVIGNTDYDYLIGRTESEAYELAQDAGFKVRIASRNQIPSVLTRDYIVDRINLHIQNNLVTCITFG